MTLLEYREIKNQVVNNVSSSIDHNRILGQLREFYRDDIDSNRRFDQIDTIGKLLRILEIREVLSEDNVEPLKEIARRIKNKDLLKIIEQYEVSHVPREFINYYALANQNSSLSNREATDNLPSGHPYGNVSARKKARINEALKEEIGSHWRDLARNLKIQENKIDEIDREKHTVPEKVIALLNLYEHRADPQRGFYVLCNALEKARRKDLSRTIQEIMVMNI